jgi:hypothetical protein
MKATTPSVTARQQPGPDRGAYRRIRVSAERRALHAWMTLTSLRGIAPIRALSLRRLRIPPESIEEYCEPEGRLRRIKN